MQRSVFNLLLGVIRSDPLPSTTSQWMTQIPSSPALGQNCRSLAPLAAGAHARWAYGQNLPPAASAKPDYASCHLQWPTSAALLTGLAGVIHHFVPVHLLQRAHLEWPAVCWLAVLGVAVTDRLRAASIQNYSYSTAVSLCTADRAMLAAYCYALGVSGGFESKHSCYGTRPVVLLYKAVPDTWQLCMPQP